MNKYKIRVTKDDNWFNSFKFWTNKNGILIEDATLWKDEYIYETDLSFEEVRKIPCVIAIKNLLV
jgi:hypothetical protein